MNKKANRALSILLALIMIVGLLPISAFAENDPPATGTDIVVEELTNSTEEPTKETASPTAPGELPGTGEDKEQGDNSGGEDKTAESTATPEPTPTATPEPTPTPTPEPSKAPAKQAAPALKGGDPALPGHGEGGNQENAPETYPVTLTCDPEQGTVTGGGAVTAGAETTVTATANPGYVFVGWYDGENEKSKDASYTFTPDGDIALTAKFKRLQLTVEVMPRSNGGKAKVNGEPEVLVDYGGSVTIKAEPYENYRFYRWVCSRGNVDTTGWPAEYTIENVTQDMLLRAEFVPANLVVQVTAISPSDFDYFNLEGAGTYPRGGSVTVEATFKEERETNGVCFLGWYDGGDGTSKLVSADNPYTFTVTDDLLLKGVLAGGEYTLFAYVMTDEYVQEVEKEYFTVSVACDADRGSAIVRNGGGADRTSKWFSPGGTAIVDAAAKEGYRFVGWTENGETFSTKNSYSFTVTGNRELIAVFESTTPVTTHTVTYAIEGGSFAEGTVTTEDVKDGENPVNVPTGMTPDSTHTATGAWYQGDGDTPVNPAAVSITGLTIFTWKFEPKARYTVTASFAPAAFASYGQVSGAGEYAEGSTATLTASVTNPGDFIFLGWYDAEGAQVSTDNPYSFTVQQNANLTAQFRRKLADGQGGFQVTGRDVTDFANNDSDFIYLSYTEFSDPAHNVSFPFDPSQLSLYVDGSAYPAEYNGGVVKLDARALQGGTHDFQLRWAGDDAYAPHDSNAYELTLKKRVRAEYDNPTNVVYRGEDFTLRLLDDKDGTPLKNVLVVFDIHGVQYRRTTDEDGVVKLRMNLGDSGEYIIDVTAQPGEEYSEEHYYLQKSYTIDFRWRVRMVIESPSIIYARKDGWNKFKLRLVDDVDGTPVGSGETVAFNINGVFYNRLIDDEGRVSLNINFTNPEPVNYVITAEYQGQRISDSLEVRPGVRLVTHDLTKVYGNPDQFVVRLLDGVDETPLAHETVQFNLNGVLYNRVSDGDGVVKLNIRVQPGEYIITTNWNSFNVANKITVLAEAPQPARHSVSAGASPTAGGTVSGGGDYTEGDNAALTATARAGYSFLCWKEGGARVSGDNPYRFTVTGSRSLTAVFVSNTSPRHAVSYAVEGGSFAAGTAATETVADGQSPASVPTGMTPDESHAPRGAWYQGDGDTPVDPASVEITGPTAFTWRFEEKVNCTVKTSFAPMSLFGNLQISGAGTYTEGSEVTLTATLTGSENRAFLGWVDNATNAVVSRENPYAFTVQQSMNLTAVFGAASAPVTTHTVTYAVEGGSFAEGTETTELVMNGQSPANVPTNMTPDDDHKNTGAWYQGDGDTPVDPAAVSITGPTIFTWKFEPKPVSKPVDVTVTGKTASEDYDGTEKSVSGFDFTAKDSDDGDVSGVTVTLKSAYTGADSIAKTDAGEYGMGLQAEYFEITLPDGYTLGTVTVSDGKLSIAPYKLVVELSGKCETKPFNNAEQSVTGFTVALQGTLPAPMQYTEADVDDNGSAVAKGTQPGTYPMGLDASKFTNKNKNFDVMFIVAQDGQLVIEPAQPISYTVTGGADSTWTKDSGDTLTVTVTRSPDDASCFSHFTGVEIDGTPLVNGTEYTAGAGSTVVTLKAATLQKLTVGSHTVTVLFDDGKVSTGLTVRALDSRAELTITSNCEELYGFDALPSYRFFDGDQIMLPIGDVITYTITVTAKGNDPAENIVIIVTLPDELVLLEGDLKQSIRSLDPDDSAKIVIKLKIKEMPDDGSIDVTATAQCIGMQDAAAATNKLKVKYGVITSAVPAEGGSITAPLLGVEGAQTVSYAPNQGYRLKSLTLDGKTLTVSDYPDSYTFAEMTQDHFFTAEFEPAPVSKPVNVTVTGNTASVDYDGTEKTVSGFGFTAKDSDDGDVSGVTVTLKSAYVDAASIAKTDAGEYGMGLKAEYFDVTLPDGYTLGKLTVNDGKLSIAPADISTATVNIEDLVYNSAGVWPEPTVTWNGITLQEDSDYDVACSEDVNVGDKTATITGKGNYTGRITAPFKVVPLDASDFMVIIEPESAEYNGKPWTFVADMANISQNKISVAVAKHFSSVPLESPRDYDLSWSDSTEPGTVTVTATMKGNYTGTIKGSFIINKAPAPSTIAFPTASDITYGQTLADSTLTGGSMEYGTFAWDNPSYVPDAGTGQFYVIFTPYSETEQYYEPIPEAHRKQNVSVTVAKATPTLTLTAKKSGNTAILSAAVTSAGQGDAPTGTVWFEYSADNGSTWTTVPSGFAVVLAARTGTATLVWDIPDANTTYQLRASYSGDSNHKRAEGSASFDPSKQDQAALQVEPSKADPVYGDTLTFSTSGGSGNGAVTYAVSDPSVMTVDANGKAVILKAGAVNVTATKAEDSNYYSATATIPVTIKKATMRFTAEDKTVNQGEAMPALTFKTTGLVNGDAVSVEPVLTTSVANTNNAGDFTITISGGTVVTKGGAIWTDCYEAVYEKGWLTINAPVTVTGITLNSDGAKKIYTEGDDLDVSGLTLTVSKSDGSKETVDVTASMVNGFNSSKPGEQTLTVKYEGFTAEYKVEVKAKTNPPTPVTYTVTSGGGSTWTKGSAGTLDFTVTGMPDDSKTFGSFTGIEVNGAPVAAGNYTATAGSVNIRLKAAYLEGLAAGEHTLTARFADGSAQAKFTVKEKEQPVPVYDFKFTFTKIWQGGHGDSIDWVLHYPDGAVAHKKFNKKIVSETEWRYEAWFASGTDYYIVEKPLDGYMVRYENVGAHADVTDRCYNGGTIINYKVPKTGDDADLALWLGCALAGLILLPLSIHAGKRKKAHGK